MAPAEVVYASEGEDNLCFHFLFSFVGFFNCTTFNWVIPAPPCSVGNNPRDPLCTHRPARKPSGRLTEGKKRARSAFGQHLDIIFNIVVGEGDLQSVCSVSLAPPFFCISHPLFLTPLEHAQFLCMSKNTFLQHEQPPLSFSSPKIHCLFVCTIMLIPSSLGKPPIPPRTLYSSR